MTAARRRRVDRRAGAADARGNALAARARRPPPVHRRRRRLGGSRSRPTSTQELERVCAAIRGSSASATSCRRSRTAFSNGPRSAAASRRLERARPDLRHPRSTRASCPRRSPSRARFRGQRFVLDHLGKPDIRGGEYREWRRHFGRARRAAQRMLQAVGAGDRSGLARRGRRRSCAPYLDAALEAFGPSRLMIGSDWPVCRSRRPTATSSALVRDAIAEYSADEQEQMLGGTAQRFLPLVSFRLKAEATDHEDTERRLRDAFCS